MLSRRTIRLYAEGVDSISDEAAAYIDDVLERAWGEGLTTAEMRELAIEAIMAASDEYGGMTRELACSLYEQETGEAARYNAQSGVDREAVERSVRYQAGKLDGSDAGFRAFSESCQRQVRTLARRGVNEELIANCRTSKGSRSRYWHNGSGSVRFARVPQGGDTCTFCAMLASRGFVYWTRKTAGEFNHYHANCRCLVVPDDGSGEVEGYDPGEWLRRWRDYEEIDARDDLTRSQKAALKTAKSNYDGPFWTRADPALDYFGPAEDDDPDLLEQIKEDLKANGVEINVTSRDEGEYIAYGPSSSRGEPGNMHVTEGMSLSAWMHEYEHFRQDRDLGFPPFSHYLADPSLRASMETAAYGVEIERAKSYGYNDLVDKLQGLLEAERGRLNG